MNVETKDWKIKVRIVKKYEQQVWRTSKANGYLRNFEIIDDEGTVIKATLWNEAVDKFGPGI